MADLPFQRGALQPENNSQAQNCPMSCDMCLICHVMLSRTSNIWLSFSNYFCYSTYEIGTANNYSHSSSKERILTMRSVYFR